MPSIDEEYLNFLRNSFTLSALGLDYDIIATGLTYVMQGIAIEVWEINCDINMIEDNPATGTEEYVGTGLSGNDALTVLPGLDDYATLYKYRQSIRAGVATYLPLLSREGGHPRNYMLRHPKLYAFPEVYHYLNSSNSSQFANAEIELGFMYVDLGKEGYYEVLQQYMQIWG